MDKEELVKRLRQAKKSAGKEGVEKVILFGSRATETAKKDSDVDLIVVSRKFRRMRYGRSIGLRKHFRLGLPVDFLCYTPEEFRAKSKGPTIVRQALKEGVEI